MKCAVYLVVFFTIFSFNSIAQPGNVYTIAGGGLSTAEGIPATTAQMVVSAGVGVDGLGNVYVADNELNTIRKINHATGLITTVAGTSGSGGFSGDGGPATNAQIYGARGLYVDFAGNIFIADYLNARVRRVDALTGTITTVGGGGSSTVDGIPATNHSLNPLSVYVDNSGNVYAGGDNKLYKISSTTGIINTIAGTGTYGIDGDGGPATNARISTTTKSTSMDAAGNIFLIDQSGNRIRRIDAATGIITTVAGGGSSTADGIPATDEQFNDLHGCTVDALGNIFIADWNRSLMRRVDAVTGIITTIGGVASGGSTAEGIPALSAQVTPYLMCIDPNNSYIYYSNFSNKVRGFSYSSIYGGSITTADSFTMSINHLCNGPQITATTPSYHPGRRTITNFGDGLVDTSLLQPGYISGGYTMTNHTYAMAGTYTITQYLADSTEMVDTATTTYTYTFCRTLPVKFYYENNSNCSKDPGESYYTHPSLVTVDSNGVTVDTLSVTSGFNYNAYAGAGDIYSFRTVSTPDNIHVSCPASSVITDTISATVTTYPDKYIGLSCSTASSFDLSAYAVVPVTGMNDQWGNIYVHNSSCAPTDATVTLRFSPKYVYDIGSIHPAPSSVSGNTITWTIPGLSAESAPVDLYYAIWHNPATGYLTAGDTVWSSVDVTPTFGDANPTNNSIIFVDTVKASCDPNFIEVSPSGCLASGTNPNLLQYTIHFENTGTDTAHNIYVLDTLPNSADVSSLRILMASAVMNIDIQSHDMYKVARFDFPNINLLDSSHHNECDGVFMYTINTNPGLPDGTDIMNRVGIYFDYNSVVMTNETHNAIGNCTTTAVAGSTKSNSVTISPNPATDELVVSLNEYSYSSYSVLNTLGQQLLSGTLSGNTNRLNIRTLSPGVYYITLKDTSANVVRKFVKL